MAPYEGFAKAIRSEIEGAQNLTAASGRLANFSPDHDFFKLLGNLILDSLEISEALGRTILVRKDQALSDVIAGSNIPESTFVCGDGVQVSFDIIPDEALRYLRYKAFSIAGVEQVGLVRDVRAALLTAVQDGLTRDQFLAKLNDLFDSWGVTRISPHHIDTIFRTNTFTSYAVGKLSQATAMVDRFPMWRYSAIRDERTRPAHRELDGHVFRTGEGPLPPIDYNCRCTAIYLHITQCDGLTPEDWSVDPSVRRFDTRRAFETWRADQLRGAPSELMTWIDQAAGTTEGD